MKKKIQFSTPGYRADFGDIFLYRMLPNKFTNAVGPFIFIDSIPLVKHINDKRLTNQGTGAHPHRGFATLTYLIKGECEHFDSKGFHSKIYSGGVQWMNAGTGILHHEILNTDIQTGEMLTQGFQIWINLPSKIKEVSPEYVSIDAKDVPVHMLKDNNSWLKVIVGEYENLRSKIPNYSEEFLYHIHLKAGQHFIIDSDEKLEYSTLLTEQNLMINEIEFEKGEIIGFEKDDSAIEFKNKSNNAIDFLLFGGKRYEEPIITQGPFVMNSQEEIANAYKDFYDGKYGEIEY